jgi:hypothetical protein
MPKKSKPTGRHIAHMGFTIPGGAEELNVPEGALRRAVENGEVETVKFAGLRRIPPREIERLRSLFKAAHHLPD